MKDRDKKVLNDLSRFRAMTTDQIAAIHFRHLKYPVNSTNAVLRRLRLSGYIESNTKSRPYIHFPIPSIKKDGAKVNHFLELCDVYIDMLRYGRLREFVIEPKLGSKGTVESDAFIIWQGTPIFLELQRTVYSKKVMDQKFKRYRSYYESREWEKESWQPKNKKVFPFILMITDTKYSINTEPKVIQVRSIDEFIKKEQEKRRKRMQTNGTIKIAL